MTSIIRLLAILLFSSSCKLIAQDISIGERHSFKSEILNEERSYQIYLPPSYHSNTKAKFPVIYLLDGDYNFHYDSGLIEFLSNSAFTIPDMILVGISDNGGTKQLENSDPKKNADNFIQYIQSELKPLINENYRTTNLDILIGHSKFGILATHYWMSYPNDFDVFLAIDPSYWFNEYEIVKRLETQLQKGFNPDSKIYIAQANTEGMGIDELITVLKTEALKNNNWQLNPYLEDNHGSLHMKAITDVLNSVFEGWDLDHKTFYALKSGTDVINHYKKLNDRYDSEFLLPWYSLGNITYYYIRKSKTDDLKQLKEGVKAYFPGSLEEYNIQVASNYLSSDKIDKAEQLFKECLASNPESYKALEGLSKIALSRKDNKSAISYLQQSIKIAKKKNVRQYYLNVLHANLNEALKN